MSKADKFTSFHLPEGCPQKSLTYSYMWADTAPKDVQDNAYLDGDTAVVFGSFQEDPAVVFLSPLVLTKKSK